MTVQVIEPVRTLRPDLLRDCPPGEVRPIVFWPSEILSGQSVDVEPYMFGSFLDKLVADMVTTMYMTGGIGLSAIQVGKNLKVFVADLFHQEGLKGPGQLLVAINPTIEYVNPTETETFQEGCLSFPGVREVVERPKQAILRGRTRAGEPFVLPVAGMLGRVVQHEMDHIMGETFLDRMKPLARRSAIKNVKRFHAGVRSDKVRVSTPPGLVTRGGRGVVARRR